LWLFGAHFKLSLVSEDTHQGSKPWAVSPLPTTRK
jgi:hypothetical protein